MKLFFVGGTHGSGKSSLCKMLSAKMAAVHISASELVSYAAPPGDRTHKAVADISENQIRILDAIQQYLSKAQRIVLDGHYAVLHVSGIIQPVPVTVFQAIRPVAMILVEDDPGEILRRVHNRGDRGFDLKLVRRLMRAEGYQADIVSTRLEVPLMRWEPAMGSDAALEFFRKSAQTQ